MDIKDFASDGQVLLILHELAPILVAKREEGVAQVGRSAFTEQRLKESDLRVRDILALMLPRADLAL